MAAHKKRWSHQVQLAADVFSVASARDFVTRLLVRHHRVDLVDDVQVVVSELVTNALVHGEGDLAVTLRGVDGVVVVEVEDGSHVGPTIRAPAELETSGRGVAIVNQLSSSWGVNRFEGGGKSVWAAFVR